MISVGPGVVTSIVGNLKGGGHLIHPTVWTVQVLISFLKSCILFAILISKCKMYNVQCKMYNVQCTMYKVKFKDQL